MYVCIYIYIYIYISLTGDTTYADNFGLWQGSLNIGAHKVTLGYRSPVKTDNTVSSESCRMDKLEQINE